jgi:hypothetical protein
MADPWSRSDILALLQLLAMVVFAIISCTWKLFLINRRFVNLFVVASTDD